MKFGKDLATNMVKKWEAHYIDYEAMKRILTTGNTPEVKREFHAMYEAQLKKVSAFYLSEVARVEQAVATRNTQLKAMSAVDEVQTSGQHYQVFRDLTDLRSFTWINAEGFRKIAKKYDKLMDLRGTDATEAEMLEAQLLREPFMGNKIQEFLDGLKGDKAWSRVKTGDGAMELKIISGTANHGLAEEISGRVGVPLTPLMVKRFADGEIFVQILENVRSCDVYLVQPTCQPVNDNLMELLLTVGALRRASAGRISAIIPYYGYARQDRKDRPRVTISAADVARMIESMGVDRVVCVDLHCGQIQGFFGPRTPVDNLYAGPIALQYFKFKQLQNPVVVSPDAGGVYRAKTFKEGLVEIGVDAQMAMIIKQRKAAGVIGTMDLVGHVKDCDCIIVDDMIDTAGTLCTAANELRMMGAAKIFAFATHGLFNGPAPDRIEKSALDEVVITNTVPLKEGIHEKTNKIKQLSIGKLLAESIQCIHTGESVSKIFESKDLFASAPVNKGLTKSKSRDPEGTGSTEKLLSAVAANAAAAAAATGGGSPTTRAGPPATPESTTAGA